MQDKPLIDIRGFRGFRNLLSGGLKFPGVSPLTKTTIPTAPTPLQKTRQAIQDSKGPLFTPIPAGMFPLKPTTPQVLQPVPVAQTPTVPLSTPTVPTTISTQTAVRTPSGAVVDPRTGSVVTPPPTPTTPADEPSTPTAPPVTPETQKAVDNAEKAVAEFLKISPEAISTQEDLDKLIESTKKAFLNIEDQPIPLGFITGQLASVERRALALAEPLEAKLARLEARRTSALESSKFALERADKAAEEAEAPKPITVSPGEVVIDPVTGEEIFAAPAREAGEFTLAPGQIRFDAEGNVVATGGAKPPSATVETKAIEKAEAKEDAQRQATQTVGAISEILSDEGAIGAISGAVRLAVGNREVANRMLNLKAILTLENIDKLKGAMSDKDLLFIQQAGSIINGSISEKGTSNLPTDVLVQELKNIRGMFTLQVGRNVNVVVTDPSSNESEFFTNATREEVDNWQLNGLLIDFQ